MPYIGTKLVSPESADLVDAATVGGVAASDFIDTYTQQTVTSDFTFSIVPLITSQSALELDKTAFSGSPEKGMFRFDDATDFFQACLADGVWTDIASAGSSSLALAALTAIRSNTFAALDNVIYIENKYNQIQSGQLLPINAVTVDGVSNTNFALYSGSQTIAGIKTFTSPIQFNNKQGLNLPVVASTVSLPSLGNAIRYSSVPALTNEYVGYPKLDFSYNNATWTSLLTSNDVQYTNLLINPFIAICKRNGISGVTLSNFYNFGADRWIFGTDGSGSALNYTFLTSNTGLGGDLNGGYARFVVTNSPGANRYVVLKQVITNVSATSSVGKPITYTIRARVPSGTGRIYANLFFYVGSDVTPTVVYPANFSLDMSLTSTFRTFTKTVVPTNSDLGGVTYGAWNRVVLEIALATGTGVYAGSKTVDISGAGLYLAPYKVDILDTYRYGDREENKACDEVFFRLLKNVTVSGYSDVANRVYSVCECFPSPMRNINANIQDTIAWQGFYNFRTDNRVVYRNAHGFEVYLTSVNGGDHATGQVAASGTSFQSELPLT